ncbi:MAG: chromosome segregation protein SMC [Ignavibacteriales bacterium]|nr:MAG: chromosome segregation protein SMC [Ignavibacteriales bacterium]
MYLSKLEILGFKSFAQKTTVNFNEGVTSIVGPNGCGKTNIVDAIRWCLGEQRSGALRSDKMENVIFNGTSSRKPMGMAEVSLTIENTKGILPTEYTDVTITRRIFRSGESEYLLNKNICRLKDITNLFLDTGIGANAYSVIELKMVETILSSKAEERRIMFEEAAGINKYKLRRRLALRKLDEVKADLTRVNDIVSEVEKKVNSLERQAKKADRYNKISSTLRELELDLAERELALFNFQKSEAKTRKEENFKTKLSLESELSRLDDEIKEVKSNLLALESKLKEKQTELNLQTEKIYNSQNQISLSEERNRSLEKNIERFRKEIEELKINLESSRLLINNSDSEMNSVRNKIGQAEKEKEELNLNVESLKVELDEKRSSLKNITEDQLEKFKEIANKSNDLSNIESTLQSRNNSIQKLNEKISSLTGNIAKTVGFIEDLSNEKSETEKRLAETELLYTRKQQEKEELEKALTPLKEKELEEKSLINALKEKISFVQNLIDNLEGISKGAKYLLENNGWSKSDKTLVAHAGNASDELRFAVEAALKNNLNNLLVESVEELRKGIQQLKRNKVGKASFLILDPDIQNKKNILQRLSDYFESRKAKKLSGETGFKAWAKDCIQTDVKWKPFFDSMLSGIAIVDTLETALNLHRSYPSFTITTLNGDYLDKSGIVEAGSEPKPDDSLFGRKQLLENLKNEFPAKEKILGKLRDEIKETEEKIDSIDLKVLSEKGRLLVNDIANLEKQISQFGFEKDRASDEIEKARREINELAAESNSLDNQKNKLKSELDNLEQIKLSIDTKLNDLEKDFGLSEASFNSAIEERNKISLLLERLSGELKNINNSVKHAEESIEATSRSIQKRTDDISASNEELTLLASVLSEEQKKLSELESLKSVLNDEEKNISQEYTAVRNTISETESHSTSLRKQREQTLDEIHSSDMRLNELEIKTENLLQNVQENYSLKVELKQFDDLQTFDFKQRTEEVHQLKQQVRSLGAVNLLAYSEFEEEKERFNFLMGQRNDLVESEKDIVRTIEEINTTAQSQFMETFEKIRGHFINIFRGLFNPGDEADLRMEENADPLEAKIEIIAKPKGKRPTSIELLSGGEKTLTAIALLFAIYLVKPSPFCILDEIDAPLDDANIDRFTRIIRDFSKDTQFIVVTHNKRTMEAASTLYGVTMQEEGISKLVSVRFNEDLNFVS